MKTFRQLGFLKINFRRDRGNPDEHRVMALFRNRAELKKAYGELQDEIYRLKDRVKQQEGATARVQEMLATLETRLGGAETGYPALVFYQLRDLWQKGRQLLTQFVADLARQQEDKERRQHVAECNRRLFARREEISQRVRAAETDATAARERLGALQARRVQLNRFWHYFKRRELEHEIHSARTALGGADARFTEVRSEAEQLEAEEIPEFPGLSVESRRAINLAAIAFAEVLCARLAKTPLVQLARDASSRREVADEYGDREDCGKLIAQIAGACATIQMRAAASELRDRTERLKQVARYRHPADTSPTPESIAFPREGVASDGAPNVLAEESWDLFRILLR